MVARDIRELLLAPRLEPARAAELLSPFRLTDFEKADASIQAAAGEPGERLLFAEILEDFLNCVALAANPDQAVTYFERFTSSVSSKAHLFTYLRNSKQALEILARCLGGSVYMAEILIRDPHLFYWVTDTEILHGSRPLAEIQRELAQTLKMLKHESKQFGYLRTAKRREMLWIGVRDLLRIATVEETLSSLSVVAESLVSAACEISARSLKRELKIPLDAYREFTILAMGKLGGGELNFSSDVDLMFLYDAKEQRSHGSSPGDYFRKLAQKIAMGLSAFTSEGYVYRVDLRLRPEGDAGNLADSLEGYERYYRTRMGAWERLALLKAWPIAGSRELGERFLEMSRPFVYRPAFNEEALAEVRHMKSRIDGKVLAKGQGGRNVKLGTGGIREIELVVQSVQAVNGDGRPQLLERNTLRALDALQKQDLISTDERDILREAYLFLRDVENKLQMVDDAQTHSLPREQEELRVCSRLLGYSAERGDVAEQLTRDFQHHTGRVSRIYEKYVVGRFQS